MLRLLLLFALALTSCNITAPPRDNAQWQSEVHGVSVTWRATAPGTLGQISTGHVIGHATAAPLGTACVVDIDLTRSRHAVALVAANEYMHCAQAPDPRAVAATVITPPERLTR